MVDNMEYVYSYLIATVIGIGIMWWMAEHSPLEEELWGRERKD